MLDLLIYLALSRFRKRPRISELPPDLQLDVRAFFSTYRRACELADGLLFSAGKLDVVDEACKKSTVGKQTRDALYLHISALSLLPPILRIYEGCARAYIGAVEGANVVKLSKTKAQVSYLYYPNFENDPHPALEASLVVPFSRFTFDITSTQIQTTPSSFTERKLLLRPITRSEASLSVSLRKKNGSACMNILI